MTIFNVKIDVKGLSIGEYYLLGINFFKDPIGYTVILGLVILEVSFSIGNDGSL